MFNDLFSQEIQNIYLDFLKTGNRKILRYQTDIINIFIKLGIKDRYFPVAQQIGLNYINSGVGSVFKNFTKPNKIFINAMLENFEVALGILLGNIRNTFNIIYWIDFFLFLPQIILKYFEIEPDVLATKILQVFYWFFLVIWAIFKSKAEIILTNYFNKLF